VHFDLVDRRRHLGMRKEFFEMRNQEVAHADSARTSLGVQTSRALATSRGVCPRRASATSTNRRSRNPAARGWRRRRGAQSRIPGRHSRVSS
jgi:hypothetical protein